MDDTNSAFVKAIQVKQLVDFFEGYRNLFAALKANVEKHLVWIRGEYDNTEFQVQLTRLLDQLNGSLLNLLNLKTKVGKFTRPALNYYLDYLVVNKIIDSSTGHMAFLAATDSIQENIPKVKVFLEGGNQKVLQTVVPSLLLNLNKIILYFEFIIVSGRKFLDSVNATSEEVPDVNKISINEIRSVLPEPGTTVIVLQRNAQDEREMCKNTYGQILPDAAKKTVTLAENFFNNLFFNIKKDKNDVDIYVVASNAFLMEPNRPATNHKRAVETAELVIEGLRKAMERHVVAPEQFLNNHLSSGRPVVTSMLQDLRVFNHTPTSRKFVEELQKETCFSKNPKAFWAAYEEGKHTTLRPDDVEGPNDIADRMFAAVHELLFFAQTHYRTALQQHSSPRRLVIWVVSHYDSISPFLKKYVLGVPPESAFWGIDYGAGITITVDLSGKLMTWIQNRSYIIKSGVF